MGHGPHVKPALLPWTQCTDHSIVSVCCAAASTCGAGTGTHVRYLWQNDPCPLLECPLYSAGTPYKLPASPFWAPLAPAAGATAAQLPQ